MNIKPKCIFMMIIDYATIIVSYFIAFFVSDIFGLHFASGSDTLIRITVTVAFLFLAYLIASISLGLYKIIHRFAQPSDYLKFLLIFAVFGIIFIVSMSILNGIYAGKLYEMFFYILIAVFAVIALMSTRIFYRVFISRNVTKEFDDGKNALIVGCGEACLLLLSELRAHPERGIKPVTAVDKDVSMVGRRIAGLKIQGTDKDIPRLCKKYGIEMIIIAIPSADNKLRSEIIKSCEGVDAEIKMLPRVSDFSQKSGLVMDKLRDFTMEELLGREPINIDHAEINSYFFGKTVLVTGGGGSIGSELCRQIAYANPKKLIIVDIYENNVYDIQQELKYKYGTSLSFDTIIASVRDADRINCIVAQYKPDIVIHAAAHKHVPLMEVSPQEAVKNNVFGTYNTAKAAIKNGVDKFILISTDKAVNPTNIMGASKRMCEMVIQSLNGQGTKFSAVRFGNVLGSNGSVIPLFKKQIELGGPVTVTHPEIIRFFMTIPEAVQLVLLASTKATGGEIFVLNMGSPVKIADLAKRIIKLYGKKPGVDIEIKYSGLRPGEKLFEEIMMQDEHLEKTQNDKIYIGHFVDFDKKKLEGRLSELCEIANNNAISQEVMLSSLENKISEIVPTFHRTEEMAK